MQPTIDWQMTESAGQKRKFWGVSAASEDAEIVEALSQQWRQVFANILGWYSSDRWNTLVAALDGYEGAFDFAPRLDFDLRRSLPGCHLQFPAWEGVAQADYPTDEEFEAASQVESERYLRLLVTAWEQVRTDHEIQSLMRSRPVPFRVVDSPSPGTLPLLEMVLAAG